MHNRSTVKSCYMYQVFVIKFPYSSQLLFTLTYTYKALTESLPMSSVLIMNLTVFHSYEWILTALSISYLRMWVCPI